MSPQPNQRAELVHAYMFTGEGAGAPIGAEAALKWLKQRPRVGTDFIWLHFSSPHGISEHWLEYVELSAGFKDVLHEERRSSRLAHSPHGLFAVLNDVSYDPSRRHPPEVATLWVSIRQRSLLSAWDKPLRSVELLLALIARGHTFHNPLALVIQLLSEQEDVLVGIVRSAADTTNGIESQLTTNRLPKRAVLGALRRDLIRLQRLLAPEPASLFRLVNRPPKWARDEEIDYLHLATEDFAVGLRDMAGLQERIKLLEEEIAARVGERTNRSLFILTSVTVISLPMSIAAALFGMNVGGLPFKDSGVGFWVVFMLSALLTVAAAWLVFRLLNKD